MSEERGLREYMPGDAVRVELHVENDGANLDNDQGRNGGRRDGKPYSGRGDGASYHPEGEYALEQVHVRCASGRIYRFTSEMLPRPGTRFRVVKEPAGRMVLKGVTLMD